MNFPKLIFVMGFVLMLPACAHHRDVRPSADGVHRVVVTTKDPAQGTRQAISQANHFCEKRNLSAAFVEESQEYTGDLDEKTYQNARRAARVAKTVGGGVWVFSGGRRESNVGGVVALGGAATEAAIGDGYTVEMRFECV